MEAQEEEFDLDALEESIQSTMGEPEEEVEETTEELEEEINFDELMNSDQPIALAGLVTEEQASEEAAKRGWREDGEDRFGHKISAIEFLERAPMFNKIGLLKGDVDTLKKQQQTLLEQNKQIAQKAIDDKKKLNDDLKAAKDKLLSQEYLDSDDVDKLKNIDKRIDDTSVVETVDNGEQLAADYEVAKAKFVSENDWYRKDYAMTNMADDIGTNYVKDYHAKHGSLPPPDETFSYVIEEVKKAYPEEKPQRTTRVASTRNRTVSTKVSNKKTLDDIPEESRALAREVMEATGLSEDEYLKTYQF